MRGVFLCLVLLLTLAVAGMAQGTYGYLDLSDGRHVELNDGSGAELDRAFGLLFNGQEDGKLVMIDEGEISLTVERAGQRVTLTVTGQPPEVTSLEEAIKQLGVARDQGHLMACQANLKNLGLAVELWAIDHGGVCPESLSALTADYIDGTLKCPTTETGSYGYKTEKDGTVYEVHCGGDHSRLGYKPGYPAYNGANGLIDSDSERVESEQPGP